jgi:benzodiazapine receptor
MTWMEWYDGLWKPFWTPAPATIGLPWIVALPFAINLVTSIAFTPTALGLRNVPFAAVDILVVWTTIIWMMIVIWPHCRWVAVAQVPYFVGGRLRAFFN